MYRKHTITVNIPCRNEAHHLPEVIAKIPDFVDEIIIISNRSTDDTHAVAQKMGGRVKSIKDDRVKNGVGYGYAHMTGLEQAEGDLIATCDGDCTYPIEQLAVIIDFLVDNDLDFVSCSRYPLLPQTKIPFLLKLGVFILNLEVRLLYRYPIKDILSGMWILRKDIRGHLSVTEGNWNLSPQIKINALRHPQIKFAEIPIVQHHRKGQSKQRYWKTGFSHLWWILKNKFKSL